MVGTIIGGMAEWFKAAVLKTAFLAGNGGSNPSPSATQSLLPLTILLAWKYSIGNRLGQMA
jgi:hypothetical protein